MKYAETIADVHDLLAVYEVQVEWREDGQITLQFPLEGNWSGKKFNPAPRIKPEIPGDPESLNIARRTRNTILELVSSRQFERCTTVADQMTQFMLFEDNKKKWGIVKMTKKANQPFTIHFISHLSARNFFEMLKS